MKIHRFEAAIIGAVILINGLLASLFFGTDKSGGHEVREVAEVREKVPSESRFDLKNDTIYYLEQQLSQDNFVRKLKMLKNHDRTPELFFYERTLTNKFHQHIKEVVESVFHQRYREVIVKGTFQEKD